MGRLDSSVGGALKVADMTIGQLASRVGLSGRTLRCYADAGVLPEAGRTEAGHRLFGPDAVARARLVRTLRELGVGLDDDQARADRGCVACRRRRGARALSTLRSGRCACSAPSARRRSIHRTRGAGAHD